MISQRPRRPTLKTTMSGPKVSELQQKLHDLGFKITVDGVFGDETLAIVTQFQNQQGVNTDGVVVPTTHNMLQYCLEEQEFNKTNNLSKSETKSKYPEVYIPFEYYSFKHIKELIMYFEGKMLEAYICPYGKWTIGYGHRGPELKEGMKITEEECLELLKVDMYKAITGVMKCLKVPLNSHQIDALVSFTFNNGVEVLAES